MAHDEDVGRVRQALISQVHEIKATAPEEPLAYRADDTAISAAEMIELLTQRDPLGEEFVDLVVAIALRTVVLRARANASM